MRKLLQYLLIIFGCGFLLYSPVTNWFEEQRVKNLLQEMENNITQIDQADYSMIIEEAILYNKQLWAGIGNNEENLLDDYDSVLNIDGLGLIGKIQIPVVEIDLPIYHGEDESTLATSVGHHYGSAFPVGTKNSRAVLSAHTGLATPKLFTRVDELVEGDLFFITVLDQIHAYEVSEIKIILPTEVEAIAPVEGEDLVTLLTCTPYGVNSHRLLVTGRRTELTEEEIEEALNDSAPRLSWHELVFYYLPAIIVLLIFLIFIARIVVKRHKKKKLSEVNYEKNKVALPGRPRISPPPIPRHLCVRNRKH